MVDDSDSARMERSIDSNELSLSNSMRSHKSNTSTASQEVSVGEKGTSSGSGAPSREEGNVPDDNDRVRADAGVEEEQQEKLSNFMGTRLYPVLDEDFYKY